MTKTNKVKRKKMDKAESWFFSEIMDGLGEHGNSPFIDYLASGNFNLKLTDDIDTVAYVKSKQHTIYINKYFFLKYLENEDIDPVLMLVKHEILHKALQHEEMTMRIIAEKLHLDYDVLDDYTLEKIRSLAYAPSTLLGSLQNVTGDYHIGRYYTAMDKKCVRELEFYGKIVKGLLNDLNDENAPYPGIDFNSMSFEELYDFFSQENLKNMLSSGEFDVEYVDFDDEDDQKYNPIQLTHTIYLAVSNGGKIILASDDENIVKQRFDKAPKWYKVEVTDNEYEIGKRNEFDGVKLDDFVEKYPYCKMQEVKNINEI